MRKAAVDFVDCAFHNYSFLSAAIGSDIIIYSLKINIKELQNIQSCFQFAPKIRLDPVVDYF